MTPDLSWQDHAACIGHPGDLWFPTGTNGGWGDRYADARAICNGCPVINECAQMAADIPWGMWGRLTPEERGFDPHTGGKIGARALARLNGRRRKAEPVWRHGTAESAQRCACDICRHAISAATVPLRRVRLS